jgi:hypothetical protein
MGVADLLIHLLRQSTDQGDGDLWGELLYVTALVQRNPPREWKQ